MVEASRFLHAFAQALSAVWLYPAGHRSRQRALDEVFRHLQDLLAKNPRPSFSFLGSEVVLGKVPLREMRNWEWSSRLAGIGMQRLEFDANIPIPVEELEVLLDDIVGRLGRRLPDSTEARQTRPSGIRYGAVGVGDESDLPQEEPETATIALGLSDEVDTVTWVHEELRGGSELPMMESEAVVRSLSVAMHGDRQVVLPLLRMRQFDEYTTTHALNVSVLAMALAEWLGVGARDARAFGMAGLLHDLGKVKIPVEVLNKPGKFNKREKKIMKQHPVEGARLIIAREESLGVAAVVAYEHHIMLDGGGYPTFKYPRKCHYASKVVHVCDVYDALRTKRPYRDAWPSSKVLAYVEERSGTEFDGEIAHAFTQMMSTWEPREQTPADGDGGSTGASQQSPTRTDQAPDPPK